jgi:adenine/guanine phosphoribosyltransferase-like PRPP-binding protein
VTGVIFMRAPRSSDDRRFTDRRTAGRMLGAMLADEDWHAPAVFGLARGGVPVAYEVARILRAPLGVQVVRKIGNEPRHADVPSCTSDDRDPLPATWWSVMTAWPPG